MSRRPPASREPGRLRFIGLAVAAAVGAFLIAGQVERLVVAVVSPTTNTLEWISDLVLATGGGVATYLWLHLSATRTALANLERARIVVDTQLAVAAELQRTLLPKTPPSRNGTTWSAELRAAWRIGGDYYDFVDPDDQTRIVLIADISGKGIPAALMLAYVRAVLREAARTTTEPAALVSELARSVYGDTGGKPYITCIAARLDERERRLTYANAGHPAGLLIGPAGCRRLSVGGPPAGLLPQAAYEQETIQLARGDLVVFVTDGVSERLGRGLDDVVTRLEQRSLDASDAARAVMDLCESPTATRPTADWDDDRTVVALHID